MRIAIGRAESAFSIDGINFFIWELAEALMSQGHEVFVISGCEDYSADVHEVFEIDKTPTTVIVNRKIHRNENMKIILSWLCRGSRILNKISPDMLICNGVVPLFSPIVKMAVCHDLEFRGPFQRQYSMCLFNTFDKVAVTSTELRSRATFELGLNPSKIARIPVCVGTRKYHSTDINEREHAILHVGTWIDKNLKTTVDAFRMLSKNDPQMKLYIVGDMNWSLPQKIVSTVEQKTREKIICLGQISREQMKKLISKVKVTCVPSTYRVPVLSPTVLESLASGTPVIGSSTGISCDILINERNGFRVNPLDAVSMAQKISILTKNDELWNAQSGNALTIIRSFDSSVVAKEYIRLYNHI